MSKPFWNLSQGGLEVIETKQDFGAKLDELDYAGDDTNHGKCFGH